MNSTLNPQNEISELARVQYAETCDAQAESLPGFSVAQSSRILARLASHRASVAGKLANSQAWEMLASVRHEIAGKLATLRERHALLDSI